MSVQLTFSSHHTLQNSNISCTHHSSLSTYHLHHIPVLNFQHVWVGRHLLLLHPFLPLIQLFSGRLRIPLIDWSLPWGLQWLVHNLSTGAGRVRCWYHVAVNSDADHFSQTRLVFKIDLRYRERSSEIRSSRKYCLQSCQLCKVRVCSLIIFRVWIHNIDNFFPQAAGHCEVVSNATRRFWAIWLRQKKRLPSCVISSRKRGRSLALYILHCKMLFRHKDLIW